MIDRASGAVFFYISVHIAGFVGYDLKLSFMIFHKPDIVRMGMPAEPADKVSAFVNESVHGLEGRL